MLKGYTGKGKDNKYHPMLFSEILKFYQEAPKQALKLFWSHIKRSEYKEAINLLKKFLNLDISDETIRDFLQDEGEQIVHSSKKKRNFPQRGFLPNAMPYALPKKERSKADKYWKSSKAEILSPTGFNMKTQIYEDSWTPKAIDLRINKIIASNMSNETILNELFKIKQDLATFNDVKENKGLWSIETEKRVDKLIKNFELENKIQSMLLEGKLEDEIIKIFLKEN
jgi:hypothetical protein